MQSGRSQANGDCELECLLPLPLPSLLSQAALNLLDNGCTTDRSCCCCVKCCVELDDP